MSDASLTPASVRLPPSLLAHLRQSAKANRRSVNSEVIVQLERAMALNNEKGPAATGIAPDLNTTHP